MTTGERSGSLHRRAADTHSHGARLPTGAAVDERTLVGRTTAPMRSKPYWKRNIIYPTPNPELPSLGVHYTRRTERSQRRHS